MKIIFYNFYGLSQIQSTFYTISIIESYFKPILYITLSLLLVCHIILYNVFLSCKCRVISFLYNCLFYVYIMLIYRINWLEQLSKLNLKNIPIFNECIIFGLPDIIPETRETIHVINFCIFYIKYYIYIQRLFNNNPLDVYSCQAQLKCAVKSEYEICKKKKYT